MAIADNHSHLVPSFLSLFFAAEASWPSINFCFSSLFTSGVAILALIHSIGRWLCTTLGLLISLTARSSMLTVFILDRAGPFCSI